MGALTVGSYLELYTTMFGWLFYTNLVDLLMNTALWLLPFFFIITKNWAEPSEAQEQKAAVVVSLKRMEFQVFTSVIVIFFAFVPAYPLSPGLLSYQPPPSAANPNPVPVTAKRSGTTYGETGFRLDALTTSNKAAMPRIPMWWEIVLRFSSGINHAVIAALPSMPDLRAAEYTINSARIRDPILGMEVSRFATECWTPARAWYDEVFNRRGHDMPRDIFQIITQRTGDLDWLGSTVFVQTEGLYKPCRSYPSIEAMPPLCGSGFRARNPVPGWNGKKPACDEWWLDEEKGLRQKLVESEDGKKITLLMDAAINRNPAYSIKRLLNSPDWRDMVARRLLRGPVTGQDMIPNDYAYYSSAGVGDGVDSDLWRKGAYAVKQLFGLLGTTGQAISQSVKMNVLLQALPMIQAMVLFALYIMLPFGIVISEYSFSGVLTATFAIFTVKFWSALWAVAWWIDQNLIASMYPSAAGAAGSMWDLINGSGAGTKRMVLDMITQGLYIGLPVVWTIFMTWMGVRATKGTDDLMQEAGKTHAEAAGSRAGNRATSKVKETGRAAKSAVKKGMKKG